VGLNFFILFFNVLLPNRNLLLLIRAVVGMVAMLVTFKAQTSSHMIGMCRFIKTIYIHCIVIPFLRSGLGMVVVVSVGVSEGDSGVSLIDVAINLHNSSEVLVKVTGDISHHMDGT